MTAAGLQAWYEALRRSHTENTASGNLAHVREFCVWLCERKKLREDPSKDVRKARSSPVPRKKFCSKQTVAKLLAGCQDPQMKFVLFAAFTPAYARMR